jgi:very-short-patch-repair endonuclease
MALRERTKIARKLRHEATDAECLLWPALRRSFPGKHFRRQHPVGRLAIEIDGGQHAAREQADVVRSAELARRGYRVVRFWNP